MKHLLLYILAGVILFFVIEKIKEHRKNEKANIQSPDVDDDCPCKKLNPFG